METHLQTTAATDTIHNLFGCPSLLASGDGHFDAAPIFRAMREKEVPPIRDMKQLEGSVYSTHNRDILTTWLRDVCVEFELKISTLCLTIQLMDAFLLANQHTITTNRCQLAASACLWVAAKFEEIDSDLPTVADMVEISARSYSANEVLEMEELVLTHFKWRIPHTTVLSHLHLFINMLTADVLVQRQPLGAHPGEPLTVHACRSRTNSVGEVCAVVLHHSDSTELGDCMKQLCEAVGVDAPHATTLYQLFGDHFIVARRLTPQVKVGELERDATGGIRLLLQPHSTELRAIFSDRSNFVIFRSLNDGVLSMCDFLIEEIAVRNAEFLLVASHVNALGILALALCAYCEVAEAKLAIQHVLTMLSISPTQGLASADMLRRKYVRRFSSDKLPKLPADVSERLSTSFGRTLSTR